MAAENSVRVSLTPRQLSLLDRCIKRTSYFLGSLTCFLGNNRWWAVFTWLLLTAFLGAGVPRFTINQSMDAFFSTDNPALKSYQWFRYVFGSDEFVLAMYKPKDGDVFSEQSLKTLKNLEDALNAGKSDPLSPLNRITRVRSLISADYLENKGDSLINRPFIGDTLPQNEAEREAIRSLALKHKEYPGLFFSRDSSYGVIMIETSYGARVEGEFSKDEDLLTAEDTGFDFGEEEGASGKSLTVSIEDVPDMEQVPMDGYTGFVNALKELFDDSEWSAHNESYFAGNPWIMAFFDEVIIQEMGVVFGASVLIIWLVTTFAFRSLSALVWPTVTLVTGEVWTIGLIGWSGVEMTFMVNIIVFLLLSVSMAISIHIMSAYSFSVSRGTELAKAVRNAYEACGVPVILAAITTAIGLVSLCFVPILAIRNFGMFASIGVTFTLFSNLFLWPVLLAFWAPEISEKKQRRGSLLARFLGSQKARALRNRKKIVILFSVIAVIAIAGIPKVRIDTNFVEMIKDGHGIKESYRIIDDRFGGTVTFEIIVDTGVQDGVKNPELLNAIDGFQNEVEKRFPDIVVRTKSIADITKEAFKNLTDGSEKNYKIPETTGEVSQVLLSFESADPVSRRLVVDDNWQVARVTVSVVSRGTFIYSRMTEEIDTISAQYFSKIKKSIPTLSVTHSGGMRLMIDLINLVSISQIKSFSLALVVISILLFLLFGSVKFGILAMIPNIFPIAVIMGFAGWTGIAMDSDTLLVLPIAIGIAVDDTIHFLTHYKAELIHGKTSEEAIDSSIKKVGQAMVYTSVVLTSGFLVFVFSAYIPFNNFGTLSAIAIFTALAADLFLLPVLIDIFKPEENNLQRRKHGVYAVLVFFAFLFSPCSSQAKNGEALEVAKKMIDRDDGHSIYLKSILISCKFTEGRNGLRKCVSGKRKKVFESLRRDLDAKGDVTKILNLIQEPARDKGVAFLQQDFRQEGKDSLQWIYMPALKKLRRIVSSSDGPKTGSLFGSEIAYEDIEKIHLSDFSYKILDETRVSGKDVWIMEMVPTEKRRPKTSYGKLISYIDKNSYMSIRSLLYDKAGRLAKTFFSKDLSLIDGVWVEGVMIVVNHKNSRMSMMKNLDIKVNIDFPAELISTRALDDSDFREFHLKRIRVKR